MNTLEGYQDWNKVVYPKRIRSLNSPINRIEIGKSTWTMMEDNGFRLICGVENRKSGKHRNWETLEALKPILPCEIRLYPAFKQYGEKKIDTIRVVLQGVTRDLNGDVVIKIDSPSHLNRERMV